MDARIQIITIDGRLVYNDMISGNGVMTKAIDIAELANGIYYLKLETKDAVRTYKVLKQ
ncbi:MAG: T9SS type A sorting domain-containing protein [Bacteroidia bacterium]|nr:T9SS type A sorting domain-containing protein [Bacteroidia bacterium]